MVVCVYIPRFSLTVAAGGAVALAGRPLALAPVPGREPRLGEVSGAAEAFGVEASMAIGEALARCPQLELLSADPLAVAGAWETVLRALEGIGAAVESAEEGIAYFEADGLQGLHGSCMGTIATARRAIARPVKIGAGPTRFSALAAATVASARRARILDAHSVASKLAVMPIELLGRRAQTAMLVEPLRRLGVRTLGELRALGVDALSDRFGQPGILAYGLASATDAPLAPRRVEEGLSESLGVGDASSGTMLVRILGVLVDRLLARPERRGRSLRAVLLWARLAAGGTWRERVVFRQPLGTAERMTLALSLRLAQLPAPAEELGLTVEHFGPAGGEQHVLLDQDGQARRARLADAVGQVRAAAGQDAALRAVLIDPDSRIPERRVVLASVSG